MFCLHSNGKMLINVYIVWYTECTHLLTAVHFYKPFKQIQTQQTVYGQNINWRCLVQHFRHKYDFYFGTLENIVISICMHDHITSVYNGGFSDATFLIFIFPDLLDDKGSHISSPHVLKFMIRNWSNAGESLKPREKLRSITEIAYYVLQMEEYQLGERPVKSQSSVTLNYWWDHIEHKHIFKVCQDVINVCSVNFICSNEE